VDSSKLITLGIVGIGLYILYDWLVSQCESPGSGFYGGSLCNSLIGTPVATSTTTTAATTNTTVASPLSSGVAVNTTPVSSVTTAQATLANQLLQAAGFPLTSPPDLTPDQWAYYYNGLTGKTTIPASVMENVLTALGLTDATRGTPVTVYSFAQALSQNGMSGIGLLANFASSRVPAFTLHGGWA
jgi:hypothetical protein